MPEQPVRHEFTAVIEGIELPPEVVDRLSRAVQKVVLTELADVDLLGSMTLDIPTTSDAAGRIGAGTHGFILRSVEENP